jgi:hypothetical protein
MVAKIAGALLSIVALGAVSAWLIWGGSAPPADNPDLAASDPAACCQDDSSPSCCVAATDAAAPCCASGDRAALITANGGSALKECGAAGPAKCCADKADQHAWLTW